jgi:hypothetical protein
MSKPEINETEDTVLREMFHADTHLRSEVRRAQWALWVIDTAIAEYAKNDQLRAAIVERWTTEAKRHLTPESLAKLQ